MERTCSLPFERINSLPAGSTQVSNEWYREFLESDISELKVFVSLITGLEQVTIPYWTKDFLIGKREITVLMFSLLLRLSYTESQAWNTADFS